MLYLKSLAIGLVAAVAGVIAQAVIFSSPQSSSAGSSWDAMAPTRVYLAPLAILFAMGTVIAWSRLRRKNIQS
jgi:hypothetical protein